MRDVNPIRRRRSAHGAGLAFELNDVVTRPRILIHAMRSIDDDAAQKPCRIGLADPVPLKQLIETYFQDCYDVMTQILSHLG